MREFSKALIRFSWSLPLFGFQQMMNLFRLNDPGKATQDTAASLNAVSQSAGQQLRGMALALYRSGDQLQEQIVDGLFGADKACCPPEGPWLSPPPAGPAKSGPQYKADPMREEVIARYTRGSGRFSPDKKYIALRMKMYKLNGEEDGYHEGVWEAQFKDPKELMARPAPPEGPMNEPVGPVPHAPVMAHTKAHWVFGDQSSIIVAGPAASHLIPLPDGSFHFLVSTAQIITGGTGRFDGAYGLVQSLGATHVPAGANLFGPEDVPFTATTIDTFKVVRAQYRGSPPGPGPQPPPPYPTGPAPSSDFPFQSNYAEVHGYKMHYVEAGSGDPILFVHGNPVWSYLWRNVIPQVQHLGRCIAVDLIGMGKSDKPEIEYSFYDQVKYFEGFIKKLGLKNITLVIHDWGSALGLHYAMRNSDNVKGIAFMEAMLRPYPTWGDFPAALRETFQAFRSSAGRDLILNKNVMIEQLLQGSMLRRLSPQEMSCYRQPFPTPESRMPIFQFISELPIGGTPSSIDSLVTIYCERLKNSRLPKLLISADPGAITTAADVAWCRENLKNLEVVNIGPGIHFYQEDNPSGVGQAIAAWYQKLK